MLIFVYLRKEMVKMVKYICDKVLEMDIINQIFKYDVGICEVFSEVVNVVNNMDFKDILFYGFGIYYVGMS